MSGWYIVCINLTHTTIIIIFLKGHRINTHSVKKKNRNIKSLRP